MAGKIQLLTDEVIGKIAAGEVVERPSAAIKELVENSLDAGASAVTVEIRDGGISYFRVTDNGSGIQQSEIRMAFERHATSKITRAQDLYAIETLGFRGEALASIAAVSHVTCTTRTKADVSGVKVQNDGGRIAAIEEAACPEGTTFVVRDLFFNTPVRLKFLKKPATEAGLVADLMMRLILSRPDVSFRFISQGKTLYHSAGDGKLASAVFAIYGSGALRSMRAVDGCEGGMVVKGYVGIGDSARGNRGHQSFFINGRYMKSTLLSNAVEAACRERVTIGKYPVCVLHLTMPYDAVDVNVHPNKLEVRFQDEPRIAESLEALVRDAITEPDILANPPQLHLTNQPTAQTPVQVTRLTVNAPTVAQTGSAPVLPQPKAPIPEKTEPRTFQAPAKETSVQLPKAPVESAYAAPVLRESASVVPNYMEVPQQEKQTKARTESEVKENRPMSVVPLNRPMSAALENRPQSKASSEEKQTEQASFLPDAPKPLKFLGAVFNTYILVEYNDHLLLIDQHAVHERLLFDRMMKAYDEHTCGQELLIPMVVTVNRREQALLVEHHDLLSALGLTVEPFGDTEMSIRTIPMILGQPQAVDFLHEILDQLAGERGVISMERRRAAIMQMACKKAVKGGEALSEEDIRHLVTTMVDQHVTPTCPHGRPLVVALSHTELDRRFKRLQ